MSRVIRSDVMGFAMILLLIANTASAQKPKNTKQTASQVSAELVKGKLNPSSSKPGDEVSIRLKDDMKSNGQVVLRKGATITGVVRSVQNLDAKAAGERQPKSMMTIEWLVPTPLVKTPKQIVIAVQSLSYVGLANKTNVEPIDGHELVKVASAEPASARAVNPGSPIKSNSAVLSMPSVVAVDSKTSTALSVWSMSNDPLFKTGRGEVVAAGEKHNFDIFSHFSNDTVFVSPSTNFEIASGAQIQLLVGVQK